LKKKAGQHHPITGTDNVSLLFAIASTVGLNLSMLSPMNARIRFVDTRSDPRGTGCSRLSATTPRRPNPPALLFPILMASTCSR
jgi:hypothetical protein